MRGRTSSLLVMTAAMLWGTTGTAQAFAPESASPLAIGAMRLVIGGGSLLLLNFFFGRWPNISDWPVRITLLAAASMAAYQPLFFSAVAATGVAVGTVVAIGSAPILAGMLEFIFRKEQPEARWWWATLLAILGCVFLFMKGHALTVTPVGVMMAVGAGLSFAVYTMVNKQLIERHSPEEATAVVFSVAGLLLLPVLLFHPLRWLGEANGVAVALHLGLFATALAYLLFSRGLAGIPASNAVTLALAEPLTAALLGVFVVGEELTLFAWLGVGMVLCGLALLSVRIGRKEGHARESD